MREMRSPCALNGVKLFLPMPLACCQSSYFKQTTLTSSNAGVSLDTAFCPFQRFASASAHDSDIQPRNFRSKSSKTSCLQGVSTAIHCWCDTRRGRRRLKRYSTDFAALQTSNMGALHNDIEKVLYTEEAIAQAVNKLGK